MNRLRSSRSLWQKILLSAVVLYGLSSPPSGWAAEIILPLTLRFDFLKQELTRQFYTRPDAIAPLWYENDCRYLYLDHPEFSREGQYLRFVSHGAGSAGTPVLNTCLSPLAWRGFLEVRVTPYVTSEWQLRFQIHASTLYNEDWKKGLLTGVLWDTAIHFVTSDLSTFTLDLTPPREDILSLVRLSVRPAEATQVEAVLRSAVAKTIAVTDRGVRVQIALTVPDALVHSPPPPAQPEAPLSPSELEAYHQAMEHWDAFLVFVVKGVGGDIVDPQIREDLIELLLTSRYALLPALSGELTKGTGDPVRQVFLETWNRLHEIMQSADQRGVVGDKILRYVAFINAGDALLALDKAAPGLGIELSADGLRRLARLLRPEATEDPLAYSADTDRTLRTLFGLPAELELSPAQPASPQSNLELFRRVALIETAVKEKSLLVTLRQRLDHWVPEMTELSEYRPVVDQLLGITSENALHEVALEAPYHSIYQTLMPATALKESCWRHFQKQGEEVTPLTSPSGSIGLMQVNPHVWRGFYEVTQLKQNPVYNAAAGAEILMRYFQKYGVKEGQQTKTPLNSARAAYAVYNAGPKAADRYRSKKSTQREQQVDALFWEIYQGFAAEGEVDLYHCRSRSNADVAQKEL